MKAETQRLQFATRADFRAWLAEHAGMEDGVWLVFGKTKRVVSLTAAEALEEALCFGWIDGQMQRVDADMYVKYFKQRAKGSTWSEKNRKLVEKLEREGRMTEPGRAKVAQAKESGTWAAEGGPQVLTDAQLEQFCEMVRPFETAYANLMRMTPSVRRTYAGSYFFGAKTDAGKQKRLDTIIRRLELNLDPMQSLQKALEKLQGDSPP